MPPPSRVADVFISYASEDREVAHSLAEALRAKGLTVWYDRYVLRLGDRLRQVIDQGLSTCKFGVVILSPSFLKKNWPQFELEGLLARETPERPKVILPVWHNITFVEVRSYSPIVASRLAAKTEQGLDSVVEQILDAMEWQIPPPAAPPLAPPSAEPPPAPQASSKQSSARTLKRLAGFVLVSGLLIFGLRQVSETLRRQRVPGGPAPTVTGPSVPAVAEGRGSGAPEQKHAEVPAKDPDEENHKRQTALLKAQLPLLRDLRERQELGAYMLASVSADVPRDLWLDELSLGRKTLQLKGGALSEQSIRLYSESLNKSDWLGSADLTLAKPGEKSTSYAISLDSKLSAHEPSDALLSRAFWEYATPETIDSEIGGLGGENADPRQRNPVQKGFFELRSMTWRRKNISYAAVTVFFDRLARLPHLVGLRTLTIQVSNPSARTLVVDLTLEIPVLNQGVKISENAIPPPESGFPPVSTIDPFRSVVRPEGVPGMIFDELKLIDISDKVFPGRYSALVQMDGFGFGLVPGDRLFDAEVVQVTHDAVTLKRFLQETPVSPRSTQTVVIPRPKS